VYALELLLLTRRLPRRSWTAGDLVRELRSSGTAVADALSRLLQAGLVSEVEPGRYAFSPASPRHELLCEKIEKAYASAPISVMKAIVAAPGENHREGSRASDLLRRDRSRNQGR
jgi:hypothetical protein